MKQNPKPEKASPPRWATRFLEWYCAPHLLEEVQGDLEEEFEYKVQQVGVSKARLDYIRNVISFIKPFAIKRKRSKYPNSVFSMKMFRHYFTVAVILKILLRLPPRSGVGSPILETIIPFSSSRCNEA